MAHQQVLGHRTVVGQLDLETGLAQLRGERVRKDGVVFGEQQVHAASVIH